MAFSIYFRGLVITKFYFLYSVTRWGIFMLGFNLRCGLWSCIWRGKGGILSMPKLRNPTLTSHNTTIFSFTSAARTNLRPPVRSSLSLVVVYFLNHLSYLKLIVWNCMKHKTCDRIQMYKLTIQKRSAIKETYFLGK